MNELILVVEDSRTQAMLIENILLGHNFQVAIAYDGKEALDWLAVNSASLVLSDVVMPHLNGYELCRKIKEQKSTHNIPVILLTSLNGTEEVIEGLVAGAESFVTKPFDQDYLISHIERILADQSGIDTEKESSGVEIVFEGKKRIIQADQQQTIKLLLNIYEGAIQQNAKLLLAQEQLKFLNENLESLVDERTSELSKEIKISEQITEELKESEENWRKLVTTVPDYIALHDSEGRLLFLNHYAEGFSEKDTIERSIFDYISDESKVIFRQNFENCLNTGKNHSFEYTAYGDNHTLRNYETTFVPNMIQGKVSNLMAIARDITERKQAEEFLKISLAKYQILFNSFPLGITVSDKDGHIIESNKKAETLLGLSEVGLFKRQIDGSEWTFIRNDGSPFPSEEYASVRALKENRLVENIEMGIVKGENDITWINVTAAPVPIENYGVAIAFNDITKRKQAEAALSLSEEHFHSLFNNMAEGVGLHELVFENGKPVNYRIVDVNNPFLKIISSSREQIVGKLATEAYGTPNPPYFEEYVRAGISKIPVGFETYFAPMDRHFSISVAPWQGNGFATIFTDITDRRRAEQEIKLKNEELLKVNAEKDKFFSIIAHDLRSPLSTFLGFTKLMAEELPSLQLADLQDMLVIMEKSASNLYLLLDNLLEWAKIQQGLVLSKPVMIQLNSVVGECLEMLIESVKKKEIELTNEIPDELRVFADANMLQSILRNLVSNAVKFTGQGGRINLSAKTSGSNVVEVLVQDSGIGMSPTMLENLFQLNNQTNRKGTEGEPSSGLGLLLCKEFIEKLGGKIWVKSEEGKGSIFYFTIPQEI